MLRVERWGVEVVWESFERHLLKWKKKKNFLFLFKVLRGENLSLLKEINGGFLFEKEKKNINWHKNNNFFSLLNNF